MGNARETVYSWSGGKDSLLALQRSLATGAGARALITMARRKRTAFSITWPIGGDSQRPSALSLGIPLITRTTSRNDYEIAFADALAEAAEHGATTCVFRDIDIDAHREWCHRVAASAGLRSLGSPKSRSHCARRH
jgi:diphthine-ammonia ligase